MATAASVGVVGAASGAKGDHVIVGVSSHRKGVLLADVAAVAAHALDLVGGVVEDVALSAERRPARLAAREPAGGLGFGVVVVEMACIAGLLKVGTVLTKIKAQGLPHVGGHLAFSLLRVKPRSHMNSHDPSVKSDSDTAASK